MKLIVNADDFGFSPSINYAIYDAFKNGIVRSTSLMCNMPGFEHAIKMMKEHPEMNVGIHLVTTVGYSVSKGLKTLTDENDHFYHDEDLVSKCDENELRQEYEAQIERFMATGLKPDHIDFHYCSTPVQVKIQMELAKKYGLPVRCPRPEYEQTYIDAGIVYSHHLQRDFYDDGVSLENLIHVFDSCLEKNLEQAELMCHPGFIDRNVLNMTSYQYQRLDEYAILTSNEIKNYIKEHDIELISFKDL